MRLLASLIALIYVAVAAKYEQYPLSELDRSSYKSYTNGENIKIECIKRQIDNGEHIFDADGNIVYVPFMKCLESNNPLQLNYMKNDNIKCTVKFEDEIFHLFQLYLHKDVPLTCRLEMRPNSEIYIPVDLSFRGNVLESHFDLDPNLNIILISNSENEVVSGTGFSSTTNTTKVIIGQNVELNLNVNWIKAKKTLMDEENNIGVYWLSLNNSFINYFLVMSGMIFGIVVTLVFSYKRINNKIQNSTWNKVE